MFAGAEEVGVLAHAEVEALAAAAAGQEIDCFSYQREQESDYE